MSLKSRLLRIALIALVVVLFAGYFAFSTFLYNPLEGALEVDAGALVPRDVDFFVARAHLDETFDKFPRLAVQEQLDRNKGWQAWISSPEYAQLNRDMQIEASLAKLRESISQIPLGREPQNVFGGEDLVIAGYFKGRALDQADWAAYGRATWLGKLAASLLQHPGLLGLEKQGIKAVVKGKYVALSGAQLPRELFVTRIKDVVIVSTKEDLVKAALDLHARAYADSFFQSATYFDHIQNAKRSKDRREFEVFVNTKKLLENLQFRGTLPNTTSPEFWPKFLGRLFQLPAAKSVVGVIGVDEGATIDLHGELATELVTPEQQKFYRTRGFDQDELLDQAARMAPADTSLFVYLRGNVGDLLRAMLASAEPALRTNLEDAFRNTGRYPNLEALVNELDGALKDRAALIVRPNDYPPDTEGPPHNNAPVPAFALVLWPKNVETITAFRELIGTQGPKFGLKGRNPNEPGFYKNTEAGFETREYWSELIDGTGVIATANANELTIITNNFRMLGHILKTSTQGGEKYPRLSEAPAFQALVRSSLATGNVFAWVNPRTLAPVMRARAQQMAEDSIQIDWKMERAKAEESVLREKFPGQKRGSLTPEIQAEVDKVVDPRLESMRRRLQEEQVPALVAAQARWITYTEQCTGAIFMLSLNPKTFDFSSRIMVPLAPRGE